MAEYDVRNGDEGALDTIRVSDPNYEEYVGDIICQNPYADVLLKDSADGRSLVICSKKYAENLIKGIQKAIDLGWFD